MVGSGRNRRPVQRQRAEAGQKRREAVCRQPVRGPLVRRLGLRVFRARCRLHRGVPLRPGALAAGVLELARRAAPARVPFHEVRKHAQEHVRPDVTCRGQPVMTAMTSNSVRKDM